MVPNLIKKSATSHLEEWPSVLSNAVPNFARMILQKWENIDSLQNEYYRKEEY